LAIWKASLMGNMMGHSMVQRWLAIWKVRMMESQLVTWLLVTLLGGLLGLPLEF